jgi:hypothetical protein
LKETKFESNVDSFPHMSGASINKGGIQMNKPSLQYFDVSIPEETLNFEDENDSGAKNLEIGEALAATTSGA